ncbi:MAG: hypothetical protein JST00_13630 [Deltaproteobacteria bacterium]|nr:hypothetical protein [Deltaproteobacteria bacterium]
MTIIIPFRALTLVAGTAALSIFGCASAPEESAASTQESGLIGPRCQLDERNVWHERRRPNDARSGTIEEWGTIGTGDCSEAGPECFAWLQSKGVAKPHFNVMPNVAYCFGEVAGTHDPNDRNYTPRRLAGSGRW